MLLVVNIAIEPLFSFNVRHTMHRCLVSVSRCHILCFLTKLHLRQYHGMICGKLHPTAHYRRVVLDQQLYNIPCAGFVQNTACHMVEADYFDHKKRRAEFMAYKLDCPLEDVTEFLEKYPKMKRMSRSKFERMITLFTKHGLCANDVFKYPDAFKRKFETLELRFKKLEGELGMGKVNMTMVNITLSEFLRKYMKLKEDKETEEIFYSKIGVLMHLLGCSREQALSIMREHKYLCDSKAATLRKKLDILISSGVPEKAILERVWILGFAYKKIEDRLLNITKYGITYSKYPKSFFNLLKCSDHHFVKHVHVIQGEIQILGSYINKEDYICGRLQCTEDDLKLMIKRYPRLLSHSMTKLSSTLDCILDKCQLQPCEVMKNPRLFRYSTETLIKRHAELMASQCNSVTGEMLSADRKQYEKYLNK